MIRVQNYLHSESVVRQRIADRRFNVRILPQHRKKGDLIKYFLACKFVSMLDVKTSSFRFIIFICEKNLFWFTSVEVHVFVEFLRYVRVRYQHAEFAGYVNSQF